MNKKMLAGTLLGFCAWLSVSPVLAGDAVPEGWSRQDVDLRASGGRRVKAILYPPDHTPDLLAEKKGSKASRPHREPLSSSQAAQQLRVPSQQNLRSDGEPAAASVLIIDSPAMDGFVPYITLSITNEHSTSDDPVAATSSTVGPLLSGRQADFAVGVLDTGNSLLLIGNDTSIRLGVTSSFLTPYEITGMGATGEVSFQISKPLGAYVDSLSALDPVSGAFTSSHMMGETNVELAVGETPAPGDPDVPTALGSPLAVYYAAWLKNDNTLTRVVAGQSYTGPDISLHDPNDPSLPEYTSFVPLELRPLGAVNVQYADCQEIFPGTGCIIQPLPSLIIGQSAQSLYFLGSVDLYDSGHSAIDQTRFMLDTGAQITVIGKRVAARFALNLSHPEFEVEVTGVDGQSVLEPGFYLDRIDIPALSEWLSFTHVPVVVLDVASAEGGTLDGIIGMNLLTNYNMIIRGGGLPGEPDPSLECQLITPLAIDVDYDNDGDVDMDDFAHFQRCYTGPDKAQKSASCQDARLDADSDVDQDDLALFAACAKAPTFPLTQTALRIERYYSLNGA